jgi:hypothetical protein
MDTMHYQVAVQYDDATDTLPRVFDTLAEAIEVRDRVVEAQATDPWEGLQYVYVIAGERVIV